MELGQVIYFKPMGNMARRTTEIVKATVSKVGRKYFEVNEIRYSRFFLETLEHDGGQYVSNWKGYLSMEDIDKEKEAIRLHKKIKGRFSTFFPTLKLDDLIKINHIINESSTKAREEKQRT